MPPAPKILRSELLALVALLALALGLRLYKLDADLWYDEVFTLVNFVRLPTAELIGAFSTLNNHMFYSLQAQAAVALFGESAAAVRLPAVLFGLGSLVVIWALARRCVGRLPALAVLLLLALSYHHVWFSQNARGYTGLVFWTSLGTLLFLEGMARPLWRTWAFYAVCVAAGLYTHLSAGFFFVSHGLIWLALAVWARWRRDEIASSADVNAATTLKPVFGFGLAGLLTLLVHAPILSQIGATVGKVSKSSATAGAGLSEWRNPMRTLQEMAASLTDLGPITPLIIAGALLALAVGAVAIWRRQRLLAAIYLLHVPLQTAILLALSFRLWPRYFLVDIGFLYIAVVQGAFVICGVMANRLGLTARWSHAGSALKVLALLVMVAGSAVLLARNYAYPKQDYISARAFVETSKAPADAVAATGLAGFVYSRLYARDWATVETPAELASLQRDGRRVWFVMAFPYQTRNGNPALMAAVDRDFERVSVFPGTLGDGAVWVYRSRPQ